MKTTCPYCGVGCGVLATKRRDGSVDIKGDPDHPANFGRLCSKGSALGETLGLQGRLLHPEINGERSDWDTALDLVAEKFSQAIEDHGPDSVAFYVSGQILTEDYYVANKLMKGYIGSANIDTNSRLCMASSVAGHRKAFGTDTVPGVYEDLELADLIILVGSNLAWCHPVLYQRIEAAKQARPEMKVILIDPRRTMTANITDMHLPIKPDGDAALFCGLLTYLSKQGVLDSDFIENHTNGFEEALISAAAISQSKVINRTGLSSSQLEAFYRMFSNTQKTVTVYSQGVNQSVCGTDKVSSIINCHLATGRIGKSGMGPFSVTGQPNAMGGREVGGLANMLACHMDIENEAHRENVQSFWDSPTIAEKQGLKAVDMYKAAAEGKIKALWIMSTNPVDSMPEADTIKAALDTCPFVVVSDILEDTDTIAHANVKLPAAAWGEKDGTVTNSERRISRQRQFLEWPGETRPDWWQLAEVGKRMGFVDAFDYSHPHDIFDEYACLSEYENEGSRDFDIGAMADNTRVAYDAMHPVQWPQAEDQAPRETRFFANGNFYTPDRKARFVAVTPEKHEVTTPACPFILNTGRVRDHWHTMTRTAQTPRLSSHMGEPYCEIHPQDAVQLGVQSAGLVKLKNMHGEIIVRVLLSDRIAKGAVFVPMHWTDQFASNARVDKLVPAALDPFSGQPASKNVAVDMEPVAAAQFGFLVTREKPDFSKFRSLYWATAKCEGGWRTELAFEYEVDVSDLSEEYFASDFIEMTDPITSSSRRATFDDDKLAAALYLSREPVFLSREWLVEQLSRSFETSLERQNVLAGRADIQCPDKGPIICSCNGVGANQIINAMNSGSLSVQAIGNVTTAGTNCGSCRAEISGMLNDCLRQTKIAAE
ncbi:MAG: molybdopterin-dependent oxidoreductase [Pseudomonadota bacterium]